MTFEKELDMPRKRKMFQRIWRVGTQLQGGQEQETTGTSSLDPVDPKMQEGCQNDSMLRTSVEASLCPRMVVISLQQRILYLWLVAQPTIPHPDIRSSRVPSDLEESPIGSLCVQASFRYTWFPTWTQLFVAWWGVFKSEELLLTGIKVWYM